MFLLNRGDAEAQRFFTEGNEGDEGTGRKRKGSAAMAAGQGWLKQLNTSLRFCVFALNSARQSLGNRHVRLLTAYGI